MMTAILIGISSFLAFVSYIVYAKAILAGEAKPHRTTRFCTVLVTALSVASLYAQGSTVAIWFSSVFAVGSFVIFLLALKYGMGGWAKADIVCLIISLVGMACWQLTKNPLFGLGASITADLFGQIPMLIKTYKFPETEIWTFYFLDVLSAMLSIAASGMGGVRELAFPFYIVFIDGCTILLILRHQIMAKLAQKR